MSTRHSQGRGYGVYKANPIPFVGIGLTILAFTEIFFIWLSFKLDSLINSFSFSYKPLSALMALTTGNIHFSNAALLFMVFFNIVLFLIILFGALKYTSYKKGGGGHGNFLKKASSHLAAKEDLKHLSIEAATERAKKLNVKCDKPGIFIGYAMNGKEIYANWEDEHIDIWGPRTGKTTSRAIPTVLNAPGAILATSNKRDLLDATRYGREKHGKILVFDPQSVAGEEPQWCWNILSYVKGVGEATRLSAVLAGASRPRDAKQDSYFEPAGEELLAYMLLAAKVGKFDINDVYKWASDSTDTLPVNILREHNYHLPADGIQGVINFPHEQREGVYGVARKAIHFLTDSRITRWISPKLSGSLPLFQVDNFVRSRDSLYLLSYERQGSNAASLVTAFTMAVVEAAENFALLNVNGRLPVPLVGVLDEAANVCKWKALPDLYSHFGSRGIILITILQSWSQGVEVWGQVGMRKLWSAANVRVYGGGVSEGEFLTELEKFLGEYEGYSVSVTAQMDGTMNHRPSHNLADRRDKVLDVADLSAFPRGHAILFASGTRPIIIETSPWWKDKNMKPKVEDSLEKSAATVKEDIAKKMAPIKEEDFTENMPPEQPQGGAGGGGMQIKPEDMRELTSSTSGLIKDLTEIYRKKKQMNKELEEQRGSDKN
jgi:type IV secretory pathway TraG/TraD family ATPase VirD4